MNTFSLIVKHRIGRTSASGLPFSCLVRRRGAACLIPKIGLQDMNAVQSTRG